MQAPDFIRRKELLAGLVGRVLDRGFPGVEGMGHCLVQDGPVPEEIGDGARCLAIVDAEDLEHAGIQEESPGAGTVGGFPLWISCRIGQSWSP